MCIEEQCEAWQPQNEEDVLVSVDPYDQSRMYRKKLFPGYCKLIEK